MAYPRKAKDRFCLSIRAENRFAVFIRFSDYADRLNKQRQRIVKKTVVYLHQPEAQFSVNLIDHRLVVYHLQHIAKLICVFRVIANGNHKPLDHAPAPSKGHGNADARHNLISHRLGHAVIVGVVNALVGLL